VNEQEVTTDKKLPDVPVSTVSEVKEAVPASAVQVSPPPVSKEPVALGQPASRKASMPLNPEIAEACKAARAQKRSVSIILKSPSDIPEVERLMEGHNRQFIVRVSPRQTQKVLVRTL
jgi:hypothetical protein